MFEKVKNFISEVTLEAKRISWPGWNELKDSAAVVLVFIILLAIVILCCDQVIIFLLDLIYKI